VTKLLFVVALAAFAACDPDNGNADGGNGNVDAGNDGSASCGYPQQRPPGTSNDPRCPARYGGDTTSSLCAGINNPCTDTGLTCSYYGVGDGRPGCYAIAGMSCGPPFGADGGASVWTCVQ
jgi:hypothetical protein